MKNIILHDTFAFIDITHKAKEVYNSGLFYCYVLYKDKTESLVQDIDELNKALERGNTIGIEGGFINVHVGLDNGEDKILITLNESGLIVESKEGGNEWEEGLLDYQYNYDDELVFDNNHNLIF